MKQSPELLVGIVIIVLLLAGAGYYLLAIPRAQAPTVSQQATSTSVTATSTPPSAIASTTNYTDPGKTFSFNYPNTGTLSGDTSGYSQDWMTNASADGLLLVKVIFPSSLQPGTNFADARFTVGTSPKPAAVAQCLAAPQSGTPVNTSVVTIHGTQFTRYTESDAGAGNFYQTVSYRTIHNGQCYAIEYTIHSANIDNFPPDRHIVAFDQAQIQSMLEGIVQSFKFL